MTPTRVTPTQPAAGEGGPQVAVPGWVVPSALLLSIAGLGVSIYLTLTHYVSSVQLVCAESGIVNCQKVTTSPQSLVFGVIPVAVLGLAFFVGMLVLQSPAAWRSGLPFVRRTRLFSVIVGVGFVCYLVYTELFTIDAICLWCTSVHVLTVLLFAVTLLGTAATLPLEQTAEESSATSE